MESGTDPRRASVSSLGIGGTNAHVILEEAPALQVSSPSRPWQLLVLSAKTDSALETATRDLAEHLTQHPDLNLADVAHTLQLGRGIQSSSHSGVPGYRGCSARIEDARSSTSFNPLPEPCDRPIVFMFQAKVLSMWTWVENCTELSRRFGTG